MIEGKPAMSATSSLTGEPSFSFTQFSRDGAAATVARELAEEAPVAIEFNGVGYAVLMATPADIAELVQGFALAERLVSAEDAPLAVDIHTTAEGVIARATLPPDRIEGLLGRVRHRVSDSSCGLCGVENLEQAIRPLPLVTSRSKANRAAIFRALAPPTARRWLMPMA
jgi:FdhD protein